VRAVSFAGPHQQGTDDAPQLVTTQEVGVTEGNPSGTGGTAPDSAADSPLADYLQYAHTSQQVVAGGTADTATDSPLDDYLAAAGVDPADTPGSTTPDLPPTEVLVDDAAASTTPDADTTTADDSLAAVPVDTLDAPQEDPQHHGV
jgi:hypothetical protein